MLNKGAVYHERFILSGSIQSIPQGDHQALKMEEHERRRNSRAFPNRAAICITPSGCAEKGGNRSGGAPRNTDDLFAEYLSTVFTECPTDVKYVLMLTTCQVAPTWEGKEIGIGDSIIKDVVKQISGLQPRKLDEKIRDTGDITLVAQQCKSRQKLIQKPKPLTLKGVVKTMNEILTAEKVETKKQKITSMVVASEGNEIRFVLRMLKGTLRIGFTGSLLHLSIGKALIYSKRVTVLPPIIDALKKGSKKKKEEYIEEMSGDEDESDDDSNDENENENQMEEENDENENGKVEYKGRRDEEKLCKLIKYVYSRIPSFEMISDAFIADDPFNALEAMKSVKLFIPFKPMLAKPQKSIDAIVKRFQYPFTAEYKYDGERGQIHVLREANGKLKIKVFTRNLEDYTEKYPDVIEYIKESISETVQSCILDCEIVAYDREKDEFKEFQILLRRAKKEVNIHEIKVNVCINIFDLCFLNGKDLMNKPLLHRRELVHKSFKEINQKVFYARYKNIENEDEIIPFFDEAVDHRTEGLMCKTLVNDSRYLPNKRADTWYKLKKDYLSGLSYTVDLIPVGAWIGEGKRKGVYGAFLLACYNSVSNKLETITKVGTGFSDEMLQKLYDEMKEKEVPKQPLNVICGDKQPDIWFDPCYVWEIKGADLSLSLEYRCAQKKVNLEKRGVCLRFPRFIRVREDKDIESSTPHTTIYDMYKQQPSIKESKDAKMTKMDESDDEFN